MSHIVTINAEIRDVNALRSACHRLKLAEPIHRTVKLFSTTATGHVVELPRWRYPVVCELHTGTVHYDNYEGRWGDPAELNKLLQSYAVEKATFEARRQGYSVTEQSLEDGSIKLLVEVGGGQ